MCGSTRPAQDANPDWPTEPSETSVHAETSLVIPMLDVDMV